MADGELGEREGDQRPDRERPAEREHPGQRAKVEEQRRQHRRQGEQGRDGHPGDETMLLGEAADDIPRHPDRDRGATLGEGRVDLALERVRQPRPAVEIAAVEGGPNDDQLKPTVVGDQGLRMARLVPGLVQLLAKRVHPVAALLLLVGRLVVEGNVEGIRLHHAGAQAVPRRGEIREVGEQEPVVPGVTAKDAVVGGDAADAQRRGVERLDPTEQRLARPRARSDIRALHAEHEGGGDARPLLQRPQLAHRRGRLGQEVGEIALHAEPAGQRAAGDRHGCRHDQDGRPAFRRITSFHGLGNEPSSAPRAPECER